MNKLFLAFSLSVLLLANCNMAQAQNKAQEVSKAGENKIEARAAAETQASSNGGAEKTNKEGEINMKTALLIIDVQNDYFPGGKMELNNALDASVKIKSLLEHFRSKSMPVIHVQHISDRPGSTFFLPRTSGVEIHGNVKPKSEEKVIVKHFPNSFRETELNDYLKKNNISKLVIVGMMTHMCVDTTVRAAFDSGYDCIVAGDCCATRNLSINDKKIAAEDVQNSFLAALNGIFAKVLKKDEVIELFK